MPIYIFNPLTSHTNSCDQLNKIIKKPLGQQQLGLKYNDQS